MRAREQSGNIGHMYCPKKIIYICLMEIPPKKPYGVLSDVDWVKHHPECLAGLPSTNGTFRESRSCHVT